MFQEKREKLFFILLVSLGTFCRLLFLGKNDLWYDEAATFLRLQSNSYQNLHIYYRVLNVSVRLFGPSEFGLRFPSVLFSAGALAAAYFLFKRMFDRNRALIALALMAFSPFHLWYAQEARNYTVGLLPGILTVYFGQGFLFSQKKTLPWSYLFYLLSAIVGFWFGYTYPAFFFLHLCCVLLFLRPDIKKTFGLILPTVAFLPRFVFFLGRIHAIQEGFWVPLPTPASFFITLENFLLGYNGTTLLYRFADFFIFFSLITSVAALLKIRKEPYPYGLALSSAFSFIPLVATSILSFLFLSLYLDRLFLIFTPYYYGLLAWSLGRIRNAKIKVPLVAGLLILLWAADVRYFSNQMYQPNNTEHHMGTFLKKPFKPLAAFLKKELKDGDRLLCGYSAPVYPLDYYLTQDDKKSSFLPLLAYDPYAQDPDTRRPFTMVRKKSFYITKDNAAALLKDDGARIFYIGGKFQRDGSMDENSQSVKAFFDEKLKLLEEKDFDGLRLFVYKKRP